MAEGQFKDAMVTGIISLVIVVLIGWGAWLLFSAFLRSWGP